MITKHLIRFCEWIMDRVPYVPLTHIKWGYIIQMLVQGVFLITGIIAARISAAGATGRPSSACACGSCL